MKLAVVGKGGVGKSTLAAALALLSARRGRRVLAVDADPDANLAAALGMPADVRKAIVPIAQHRRLVEERTGARVREYGQIFKLNPSVSDIADEYALRHQGVDLLVLGAASRAGAGCACPENALVRGLVTDLVLRREEAVILDMEAGIEHLGRATARGVDVMLVVVEPGRRALDTARQVSEMAHELGIRDLRLVANKVSSAEDEAFVRHALPELPLLGMLPYSTQILQADRDERSVLDGVDEPLLSRFTGILEQLSFAVEVAS